MKNMTLAEIAKACGGAYYGLEEHGNIQVKGVVIDSREVKEDYLFIPIKGERVDGHMFISQVLEKNVAAVLTEEILPSIQEPYIYVDSCEQALKDIATAYRLKFSIPIIGIIGSVGKTSTKEMIASILAQKYQVHKTEGNFNNEIGLPLTILKIREEHEIAVIEMGISDFGEMDRLGKITKPDICVITNIGQCHLENLGSRDGILKAKTEVFTHMNENGTVLFNGDDDKLRTISETEQGIKPIFYGFDCTSPNYASSIENLGLKGVKCMLHLEELEPFEVVVPIPGVHNVYNALAGAVIGKQFGLTNGQIQKGIGQVKTVVGRSNVIDTGEILIIDDCYNANPVSMKAAIDVLQTGLGRCVAILGDMGELGENEEELHYEIGAYIAEKEIDLLLCAGPLSIHIAEGARTSGNKGRVLCFENKQDLLKELDYYIRKGDSILVKASHFMGYDEIVVTLRNLLK